MRAENPDESCQRNNDSAEGVRSRVYEEKVLPLMEQISQICLDNNISVCALFEVSSEEELERGSSTLRVTSLNGPSAPFLTKIRVLVQLELENKLPEDWVVGVRDLESETTSPGDSRMLPSDSLAKPSLWN